jgi:hypothetical protein
MARPTALAACALLALGGCGVEDPPLDGACTESADAIVRALARAPGPVALASGTRLSECVSHARSDSELQNAGIVITRAADGLAVRAERGDARAALALGYLVGAARRGAARTSGIHAQLLRRIERAAAYVDDAAAAAALRRGLRAGEATG